jgi:hypothetical protein
MMLLIASPPASAATAPTSKPTSQPAGPGLDPIIPLLDLRSTSLEKAIDTLRDQSKINIVVRWHILQKSGIERAAPVDLRVTNLPLQRVLELLGEVAGASASAVPLMAQAERGVVILSTREDLETGNPVRLYDVGDLIESDASLRLRLQIGQAATMPTTAPSPDERFTESLEQLKRVIEETIDADSWRDAGGTVGSINDFNGLLIISQTPVAHERIKMLLEGLRRK